MRIGIILRAYDRPGGIGIYSRNIVKHLLEIDQKNHYVLFLNNRRHLGTYADRPNVDEVFVPPTNQLLWDQWYLRRAAKGRRLDLLFNTKFSLPLATRTKRIMVLHGASWFAHPEFYSKSDILYVRSMMPVYCRAADFLISNSDLTTNDFTTILKVPRHKIQTVHLAADERFKPTTDETRLRSVRDRYGLPEAFLLTVTSYEPIRKNFATLLEAFEKCRATTGVHLVVIGKDCDRYRRDFGTDARGLSEVLHFPGWVEQDDLPAIYSMARAFLFPSVYEEFGIPVVEAMSCGCPVAAANTGALPELSGDAALLCDPFDSDQLAENTLAILRDKRVAETCRQRGRQRASGFSWNKAARQTLEIFERVAGPE